MIMGLAPQDVLVLLKLVALSHQGWSYNELAIELGMSPSQVHSAIKRALAARLAQRKNGEITPQVRNLEELLVHGLKYLCVPERGELTRGIPTSYGAAPLDDKFVESKDPVPVWPHPEGKVRGEAFSPIFRSAPEAAMRDKGLYELLALVDAIRGGRARERSMAIRELGKRLKEYG
jgi:hypothetical protein